MLKTQYCQEDNEVSW